MVRADVARRGRGLRAAAAAVAGGRRAAARGRPALAHQPRHPRVVERGGRRLAGHRQRQLGGLGEQVGERPRVQREFAVAGIAPVAPAPPRNISDLPKIKHLPVIVVCGDQDGLVRSARMWVAQMKKLEMNYKYVEVKGGGHIRPAFQKLPDVFDFFNKHTKSPPAKEKKKEFYYKQVFQTESW